MDKALATQIKNIEGKTGKSISELTTFIHQSTLTKHGELRNWVQEQFSLGYGDANTLVHIAKKAAEKSAGGAGEQTVETCVGEIYSGKKTALLPIHNAVMTRIEKLGDFEIAPKKNYLSLRRKKQFATVGPASKGRVEIGLNMKDVESTARLEALPPGRMCQYKVYVSEPAGVDKELIEWIKIAYDRAG